MDKALTAFSTIATPEACSHTTSRIFALPQERREWRTPSTTRMRPSNHIHKIESLCDHSMDKGSRRYVFVDEISCIRNWKPETDATEKFIRMARKEENGFEGNSADGAGILVAIPLDSFSQGLEQGADFRVPALGGYAPGMSFLPTDAERRISGKKVFTDSASQCPNLPFSMFLGVISINLQQLKAMVTGPKKQPQEKRLLPSRSFLMDFFLETFQEKTEADNGRQKSNSLLTLCKSMVHGINPLRVFRGGTSHRNILRASAFIYPVHVKAVLAETGELNDMHSTSTQVLDFGEGINFFALCAGLVFIYWLSNFAVPAAILKTTIAAAEKQKEEDSILPPNFNPNEDIK